MTPQDDALLQSVRSLRLPEPTLYALLEEYLEFLAMSGARPRFEERLEKESGFLSEALSEIEASMLASALMLSMDKSTDFSALMRSSFPKPSDSDLLALRKEIVSRALSESKEIPSMADLSLSVVRARQSDFCS